jgi:hypothetical protein
LAIRVNSGFGENFSLGVNSVGHQPLKISQNQEIETRQVAPEFVHVFFLMPGHPSFSGADSPRFAPYPLTPGWW